jgi:hypothetical protein
VRKKLAVEAGRRIPMKLTWFAGTTLRVHIGGRILVTDAEAAPEWVDRRELVSGADRTFGLVADDPAIAAVDPEVWRRRRPSRPIDDTPAEAAIVRIAPGVLAVEVPGEAVLVLAAAAYLPPAGRWADDAVIVLFGAGEAIVAAATVLLDVAEPRLLALAADEQAIDVAVAELREHLDGTGLISLEPGMAVEV